MKMPHWCLVLQAATEDRLLSCAPHAESKVKGRERSEVGGEGEGAKRPIAVAMKWKCG